MIASMIARWEYLTLPSMNACLAEMEKNSVLSLHDTTLSNTIAVAVNLWQLFAN